MATSGSRTIATTRRTSPSGTSMPQRRAGTRTSSTTAGIWRTRSNAWRRRGTCVAVVAALLTATSCARGVAGGGTSERDVLERFVGAVQRRDAAALQALVRPGNAADAEIAALLARSGGCSLTDGTVRVEYSLLLTPNTSTAIVRGT